MPSSFRIRLLVVESPVSDFNIWKGLAGPVPHFSFCSINGLDSPIPLASTLFFLHGLESLSAEQFHVSVAAAVAGKPRS